MKVSWRHSLRLRIAAVTFLLEAAVLGVVLWQTQSYALERARQLIEEQDQIALDLLAEDARQALLTLEYDTLSDVFQQAAANPHIRKILLLDDRGTVVAASGPAPLGKPATPLSLAEGDYRRGLSLRNLAGETGQLQVVFSGARLEQVYRESLQLGMVLGVAGLALIALTSIGLGALLTRRISRLTEYAEDIARGHPAVAVDVGGRDEISALNRGIDAMVESLHGQAARMKRMAYHDPLTGLANRLQFQERLEQALQTARRYHTRHALLYLDLDRFKVVNDSCGHDAGDRLLAELSNVLRAQLRGRDTLARLGGDEFGVLLDRIVLSEALVVAEKLRRAVDQFRFNCDGRAFHLGVSIGVVEINAESPAADRLLALADMACYAAKEKGRNTVEVASDDEASREQTRQMAWVPRIEAALAQHRFLLHRQPIVHTGHPDETIGWEFLLRLQDEQGQLLAPDRFQVAAERFNLMPRIEREVLRMACEAAARTPDHYPGLLFINLSEQTLGDRDYIDQVKRLLREFDLEGTRLCFEVRENAALNRPGTAGEFIRQLGAFGCRFCIEDLGNGLCNLQQLGRLNVDFVKLGGTLVQDLATNPIDARIARAIVDIAGSMGVRLIAQQVETDAQLRQLRSLGVDLAQGFALAPPEPLP